MLDLVVIFIAAVFITVAVKKANKRPDPNPEKVHCEKCDTVAKDVAAKVAPKHAKDRLTIALLFALGQLIVLADLGSHFIPALRGIFEATPGFSVAASVAVMADWLFDF